MSSQSPIRVNNEGALRIIYDACYNRMCFYAQRFLGDTAAVEDVVQDIFVTLWAKSMSFESPNALRSFLYMSVYNACMNVLKGEAVHRKHGTAISEHYDGANKDYTATRIEDEVLWEVYQAIERLPEECRKIFKLSYMENLSIEQVAEALAISPHTVKSQRARAKQLLKEKLKYLYLFVCFYG